MSRIRGGRGRVEVRGAADERFTTRGINLPVKKYGTMSAGDQPCIPTAFATFATHLLNSGADLRCIQEFLGHSGVAITANYIPLSMDRISEVYVYASAHAKA